MPTQPWRREIRRTTDVADRFRPAGLSRRFHPRAEETMERIHFRSNRFGNGRRRRTSLLQPDQGGYGGRRANRRDFLDRLSTNRGGERRLRSGALADG